MFVNLRDFRLPPRSKLDICCYGSLRSVDCYLFTHVSGQPICLVFKGQTVRRSKMGAMRFPRNGCNYQSTLRKAPEERGFDHILYLTLI